MRKLGHLLILSFCLAFAISGVAQDTLRVNGTQYVEEDETMQLAPGTVVMFQPGATIVVKGGIEVNGTVENPVIFTSKNEGIPGNGITINKLNTEAKIIINHANFLNLIQPIRFDPFWYRGDVQLNNLKLSASTSGEPVIYVAKPLLDLRSGKGINFQMKSSEVSNNANGILLEGVGATGLKYEISEIIFVENQLKGLSSRRGILHLDCVLPTLNDKNIQISNLVFHANLVANKPVGISVSGGVYPVFIGDVYSNSNADELFIDQRKNPRIPLVTPNSIQSLSKWRGNQGFVFGVSHEKGLVAVKMLGVSSVTELLDSLGNKLQFNARIRADSLLVNYSGIEAQTMKLGNGVFIKLPKIKSEVNLTPTSVESLEKSDDRDDEASYGFKLNLIKYKAEDVIGEYVFGVFGGDAVYGGGDIKWPKLGPIPMAPSVELSMGGFAEYRFLPKLSFRASYNFCRVSANNIYSPAYLDSHEPVVAIDVNGDEFEPVGTFGTNVRTAINNIEVAAYYDFEKIAKKIFKNNDDWATRGGFGIGLMHYLPYRMLYIDSKEYDKVNLRKLGTGGQYFLPGEKPYSSLALNFSITGQLSYNIGKFRVFSDVKFTLTSTDYLDDFGKDLWYGGDYNRYIETAIENNPDLTVKEIYKASAYNSRIAPNSPRATNNMTDWYFQGHIGFSYNFGKLK